MDWRFDHLQEKVMTWFALFMEDHQAQGQCKEGTTLPLCDAKTSKNNYSERRKCVTPLPGTVLDMSEWSSFNYAQGKTDTETNVVVTISFTTKVDHQTTSKIWPDVWSCLMIDLSRENDGNNEICLGVCFALCINHIHVLKWWMSWKSRPMPSEQLLHCTISSNRWPNLSHYVWFNYYYPGQKNWNRHARQLQARACLTDHAPVPAGAWLSQFFWPG